MRPLLVILFALCLAPGCTHQALRKHTVATAGTVTDLQYQFVLTNIAMMSENPSLLPWHVRLRDGVIQVNDEGRFNAEALVYRGGSGGLDGLGPRAARNVTEQWDVRPVTDPKQLRSLQAAYQKLFGIPIDERLLILESDNEVDENENENEDEDNSRSPSLLSLSHRQGLAQQVGLAHREDLPAPRDLRYQLPPVEEAANSNRDARPGQRNQETRQPRLGDDILMGWFHVGSKHEVPKNASFVGCYGKRYVWVMPEGVDGLSRFTLVVLALTELDNAVPGGRGIVFSPRGA